MTLIENFRDNVSRACEANVLTHQELAEKAGVPTATVSRILSGKMNPPVDVCERLAVAAGIDAAVMFKPADSARRRRPAFTLYGLFSGGRSIELVTPQEAMTLLGVSKSRVSQLATDGVLRKFPIGGQNYLLAKADVQAYANSDRKPGRKKPRY